ncbi:MAG: nitroreductase [Pseudomonadota bacterium]
MLGWLRSKREITMNIEQAVSQRRSTRAYTPDPLLKEEIIDWLNAAQRAPSGGNMQGWGVIVLTGEAKDAVANLAMSRLPEVMPAGEETDRLVYPEELWEPHVSRRRRAGEQMYDALGISREDTQKFNMWRANNFRFFGAPVGLIFTIDTRMGHGQWAHNGIFMQTLALLAEGRGWGTCMQECWGMLRPSLKAHLKLDDTRMVHCGMSVGVPDKDHPINNFRSERASLDDFADLRGF